MSSAVLSSNMSGGIHNEPFSCDPITYTTGPVTAHVFAIDDTESDDTFYIGFPLTEITKNAIINSAVLGLTVLSSSNSIFDDVDMDIPYSETDKIYPSMSAEEFWSFFLEFPPTQSETFNRTLGTLPSFEEFDVTDLIQEWVNRDIYLSGDTVSIIVHPPLPPPSIVSYTIGGAINATPSYRPILTIDWDLGEIGEDISYDPPLYGITIMHPGSLHLVDIDGDEVSYNFTSDRDVRFPYYIGMRIRSVLSDSTVPQEFIIPDRNRPRFPRFLT